MSVYLNKSYAVGCDHVSPEGYYCTEFCDEGWSERGRAIKEAEGGGWLRRGDKMYCERHRVLYERKKKDRERKGEKKNGQVSIQGG